MFVEEYLQDLRRDRFSLPALLLYLRRFGARARDAMVANPGAVRSVWTVALAFFAASFLAAVLIALSYDRHLAYDFFLQTALWILPAFGAVTLYIDHLRDLQGRTLGRYRDAREDGATLVRYPTDNAAVGLRLTRRCMICTDEQTREQHDAEV